MSASSGKQRQLRAFAGRGADAVRGQLEVGVDFAEMRRDLGQRDPVLHVAQPSRSVLDHVLAQVLRLRRRSDVGGCDELVLD